MEQIFGAEEEVQPLCRSLMQIKEREEEEERGGEISPLCLSPKQGGQMISRLKRERER